MLKQRVVTAVILIPLVVWGTLALSTPWFALVAAAIFALAAWEWGGLLDAGVGGRLVFSAVVVGFIAILWSQVAVAGLIPVNLLKLALSWWAVALIAVLLFPRGGGLWRKSATIFIAGVLVLVPAWVALVGLHHGPGPIWVLALAVLVWGADTGAYFAGRRFGRHKLAPQVSPGKTWEGLWGAVLVTLLLAAAGAPLLKLTLPSSLALAVSAVLISILGDLTESMFKRLAGVKDSGGLLPGHGGILDRIDSLTAAAPLFAVGLWWLGGYR